MTRPTGPHRLGLSAAGYGYLVAALDLAMPPGWEPDPAAVPDQPPAELAESGALDADGQVHPSVAMNLRILAGPQVMVDTTASIGGAGLHSVHALAGPLGAALFQLEDGAVELSLFAATDLGTELVRAVPPEAQPNGGAGIGGTLDGGQHAAPPAGRLPLAALHELGVAELLRGADPDAPAEVLAELRLPAPEARLATEVAHRTNGGLLCQVTARVADEVRSARVAWLHADAGWLGLRPDTDRRVLLEPVSRADLGVWVAPYVAEAVESRG